ncbi:hypothetical protein SKB0092_12520 [Roseomonas mucosa]
MVVARSMQPQREAQRDIGEGLVAMEAATMGDEKGEAGFGHAGSVAVPGQGRQGRSVFPAMMERHPASRDTGNSWDTACRLAPSAGPGWGLEKALGACLWFIAGK